MQKVILITGGAKRIGREIAKHFVKEGYFAAIHYNNSQQEAEKLANSLQNATTFQADLLDCEQVDNLLGKVLEKCGRIDLLVNNASIFERDSFSDLSEDSFYSHMQVNCFAPMLLAKGFNAIKEDNPHGKNIINIIDSAQNWSLSPNFLSYAISKQALWNATLMMAKAFAPDIRVNAIGPGPILPSHHGEIDSFDKIRDNAPLKRHGTTQEICAAIEFFLHNPSITGQMIAINGGLHL